MAGMTRRELIGEVALGSAAIALGVGSEVSAGAVALPRAEPVAVGIDPAGISAFIDGVNSKVGGLHGFMLLRHGKVAAEGWWRPYRPTYRHMLYSLSKSFTSTAVGLAVSEGRLSVDDKVVSFFPDSCPKVIGPNLAAMRVRDLLTMTTGHSQDAIGPTVSAADGDWPKAFLGLPVDHQPGTFFVYNSAATYMCSAIVTKLTGQRVLDYLTPRLLQPLGITGATWEQCPKGNNTGGWGLAICTEDIARFGQMLLQKGQFGGKQVVPADWVALATSKQVPNGDDPQNDWNQGYGFQFWRCRHNIYRGDGAFGQYCVVMPEQDAVLAVHSGVGDMGAILSIAWETLLPAMDRTAGASGQADLSDRLRRLEVPHPAGLAVARPKGIRASSTYRLDPNEEKAETLSVRFEKGRCRLTLTGAQGVSHVAGGLDDWAEGRVSGAIPISTARTARSSGRYRWVAEDTLVLTACYVEMPYIETWTCKFAGERVQLERRLNVSFGPTERPTVVGTRS